MEFNSDRSGLFKAEGNEYFKNGNFIAAESLYSKAIIADKANHSLYTNRAMARLRLELYETAIADCNTCLELDGPNRKARFILSQCHLAMSNHDEALKNAVEAYRLARDARERTLAPFTAQVLRCKKERWDELEKRRHREGQYLERKLIDLMEGETEAILLSCTDEMERAEIIQECNEKIDQLRATFEAARAANEKKREVPDWAIDDITFNFMVDPVMTKTGKSYERASILEALSRHPTDPITREPLHPTDLRPNLELKRACEEFLEKNGWAADW
ncbi:U-box domain-containing protein [Xylaria venustula]|nr:U-box domain-containing protein [Xylaria venustula]